jgi:hypothetical protein
MLYSMRGKKKTGWMDDMDEGCAPGSKGLYGSGSAGRKITAGEVEPPRRKYFVHFPRESLDYYRIGQHNRMRF